MKGWTLAILWLGSLCLAFWAGRTKGDEEARIVGHRSGRPTPESVGGSDAPRPEGPSPGERREKDSTERVGDPSRAGEKDAEGAPKPAAPEDASLRLLGELEELLQRGDLIEVLKRIQAAGDHGRWVIEPDTRRERALRLLWLEHLLAHRQEVLDQLEELLGVVATSPGTLPTEDEGFSLGTLAAFDDLLFALPRLASVEQRRRFRRLLERIHASGDDGPADWDAEGCLVAWDHFASAEEAIERLASADLDPREYLVLLRRVPEELRRRMDALPILQRMISAGSTWRDFFDATRLIPPSRADVEKLDDQLFRERPTIDYRGFGMYACATNRARWPDGQAFVERCMEKEPRWRFAVLLSFGSYLPPPSAEVVQDLLNRYELREDQEKVIRRNYRIR